MLGCGGAVVTESLPAWGSDPAGNGEARAGAGLYMREGLCLASSCKNRYIHICLCWPGHLPHEYKVLPQIMLPLLILLEGSRWRLGSSLSEPQQPVSSCVLIRFLSSLLCFLGGGSSRACRHTTHISLTGCSLHCQQLRVPKSLLKKKS